MMENATPAITVTRNTIMGTKTATDIDRGVGQRIAAIRKSKGISQSDVGNTIGVTFQQQQKYENGSNRVSASRLQQIAQLFEVPLSTFFDDEPGDQTGIFALLAESGAVDVLRAYASIENDELRRNVLAIVKSAARIDFEPVQGST